MDEMDILMQALQDPETQQAMVDAGLVPGRMGVAKEQLGIGSGLADTPSAEGRQVGNTYVASSPLEHMAVALRRYQGMKQQQQAMKQQQDLLTQLGQGRGKVLAGFGRAGSMPGGWGGVQDYVPPAEGTGGEF